MYRLGVISYKQSKTQMRNYILLTLVLVTFSSCHRQTNKTAETKQSISNSKNGKNLNETANEIIYFSFDNGNSWENASSGLPQKVSIGLGGVAASERLLSIATKEHGVYTYNFNDSIWVGIPTDKQILASNIAALSFYQGAIYVGTQHKGVFYSNDNGKTWTTQNSGLNNLTIRRFFEFENKLYVCTNDGFYSLNEKSNSWKLEYGHDSLQVNGVTVLKGNFYIATSKGVYKKVNDDWKNILPTHSVHNISSAGEQLYAMTYNELLLSSNNGITWQSAQDGLPKDLYTFNVLNQNNVAFAGQWEGVYSKTNFDSVWKQSGNGLPTNFAATNLTSYNGILVITTSERKLKAGMTMEK